VPHLASALFEKLDSMLSVTHGDLRARGEWPGRSPRWRSIPAARTLEHGASLARGAEGAPSGQARPLASGSVAGVAASDQVTGCTVLSHRAQGPVRDVPTLVSSPLARRPGFAGRARAWGRPQARRRLAPSTCELGHRQTS
jgi:hypothetical protein